MRSSKKTSISEVQNIRDKGGILDEFHIDNFVVGYLQPLYRQWRFSGKLRIGKAAVS